MKRPLWQLATAIGSVFFGIAVLAQQFQARPPILQRDQPPRVEFESDINFYYVLYQGAEVVAIRLATDMTLGAPGVGQLTDHSAPTQAASFYRIQRIAISQPVDTDGDGIDDLWELRNRRPGAALNGNDAREDHNGNGFPDLDELSLPIASLEKDDAAEIAENNKKVSVNVLFSKPFNGTASVLLGGNAILGRDFNISGSNPSDQTAHVPTVGQRATFEITILDQPTIDPDRYVILSILEPSTNAAAQYRTSKSAPVNLTLRITEGNSGLYAGILSFTNKEALGSHPVRVAVRSEVGGSKVAYMDATKSAFFRQGISVPLDPTSSSDRLSFAAAATGQSVSAGLRRSLGWTLTIGATTNVKEGLLAPVALQIDGLSASERPVMAQGVLQLVRIDSVTN